MKKFMLLLAVIAMVMFAFTGCDLEIRDPISDPADAPAVPTTKITVGLGAENVLNVTEVNVNGTPDTTKVNPNFKPSMWNALAEFINVEIAQGEFVYFTFTQPTQGEEAWNSWALAIYDENNRGNFMRADNWLNASTDATFAGGKWNDGAVTTGGAFENDYTFNTIGNLLPTDAVVKIKVEFDGTDVLITETVNDVLAYTATSANW